MSNEVAGIGVIAAGVGLVAFARSVSVHGLGLAVERTMGQVYCASFAAWQSVVRFREARQAAKQEIGL
jgi:hypothetical protein